MKNWWTADTHAGHRNIIKYCKRPYNNVYEMDEQYIKNHNELVSPEDIVWHLGDVAYCCTFDYAVNFIKRLNGRINLILGNHDKLALEIHRKIPGLFQSVDKYEELYIDDQLICMFHYPQSVWHHAYRGSWQLYGHVHGTNKNHGKSLDVGVDCWDFKPVSFEDLQARMNLKNVSETFHNKWDKSGNDDITCVR